MTTSFIWTGPKDAALKILFAHGAGAPMDSPFMADMAEKLGQKGYRVGRFEFPYMVKRRQDGKKRPPDRAPALMDAFNTAIADAGPAESIVIAGKSMGGRIASMIADTAQVRALLCLGYPFHPTGKPEKPRTEHLATLTTPTLICHGTRDPFGKPDEIAGYPLSSAISLHWVEDGNHDFAPRKASGRTVDQNLNDCATAIDRFLQTLPA
ncbi:alpha/beta family hydrolase [Thalassospira sp. TSL5-1]|uniref:alpha/beta family hydrolase n=1 Tax=Thalassospira sp. TSL5-1 TaxID=1544451 RepID=UPI00093C1EC9|nr:alpha/beta family hydrolase [Thalassospira sp. TSL5-1]OKH89436.1 alpha/beta hydrolase [Thalassospira sp. TSL5-1]